MSELVEANGLLFIGDPHLSGRRPGRRTDADYASRILGKIDQAISIANEHRLVPVFLGDMHMRPKENDEALKTRLVRTLNRSWCPAHSNVGNHDIQGVRLADGDTLSLIAESGALIVARESGPAAEFILEGVRVGLGFTPYGQEIPRAVGSMFPDAEGVVWVTHHDLAFEGAYPGALHLFEIEGCGLVVNGHMHLEKQPVTVGGTMWCNFGNITRTAIDAINHEPCVWQFSPKTGMVRHRLDHEKDVFDLTGRFIEEISPGEAYVDDEETSVFVQEMLADLAAGPMATPDGSMLLEEIQARFERDKVPTEVQGIIVDLFNKAVSEEPEAA